MGEENALTTLLSVLSLPPQPVAHHHQHHHHHHHHAAGASDLENGGGSAAAAAAGASLPPSRPRGRLPAVPSSVFLSQSQGTTPLGTLDNEAAATAAAAAVAAAAADAPAAAGWGSSLGRGARSAALPATAAAGSGAAATASGAVAAAASAAVPASARRHSVARLPPRQRGTGGTGTGPATESIFSRRLSAAATSFGVLAIAAGDYCNTINDVDTARTAAAVARQQNALRQRRRASSLATAASSAVASAGSRPPLSSGAPSSAKPSTVLSSKKTEDKDKNTDAGDAEKANAAEAAVVPWWRCRAALVAVIAFATTTMLNESILDLYQFYATSTPCAVRDGPPLANDGLCLDVTKTSLTVSVGGAGVVAFSLLGYPPLQKRFGFAAMCKFGLLVGIVMCLVMAAARFAYPLGIGPLLAALVVAQLLYGVGFSATSVRERERERERGRERERERERERVSGFSFSSSSRRRHKTKN